MIVSRLLRIIWWQGDISAWEQCNLPYCAYAAACCLCPPIEVLMHIKYRNNPIQLTAISKVYFHILGCDSSINCDMSTRNSLALNTTRSLTINLANLNPQTDKHYTMQRQHEESLTNDLFFIRKLYWFFIFMLEHDSNVHLVLLNILATIPIDL